MADAVAIIGMACMFPGAPTLEAFWNNIQSGFDAISDVPPGRWDSVFYDPSSRASDRLYCRRGGFIDAHASIDPFAVGVMPAATDGTEPDQLLALEIARQALDDAGYADRSFPRDRAAVILGRGNYQTPGMTRADQIVRGAQQLAENLRACVPDVSDAILDDVKKQFQSRVGPFGADTAIGLVPNLAASRIAHRLDLRGPAYTVDAACASSLVAVDQACRDLASARIDLAICGGVHVAHDVTFWSVFCQLGALSRSQRIRPFDRHADGLLLGEGLGLVVLKRLSDAERDSDRIYAVIRGVGTSSDGKTAGLMAPSVDGQLLACERAWRAASLEPTSVDLVEAHGTATAAGDEAELLTLQRVFGGTAGGRRAVLGSVKSMIGHTMPAAGAAGLIKAALAVHHGVLPPSLHCDEPHPHLAATKFRVIPAAEPWDPNGHPMRAGISAFGFGGTNGHVVLEAHQSSSRPRRAGRAAIEAVGAEAFLVLARDTPEALARALNEALAPASALNNAKHEIGLGPCRVAVANPTPERIALVRSIVARGKPRRGRDGIWFSPHGLALAGGSIAFLFPGIEAVFRPRIDDVARHFGLPAPAAADPNDLEQVGAAVISAGRLLHRALADIGVRPAAVAGHSIGEWAGMVVSGMIAEADFHRFVSSLKPGTLEVPDVVFAAAGGDVAKVRSILDGLDDVAISHDNCPHQVILCGREAIVDLALQRLTAGAVLCQKLPFRSGFHSPSFVDYLQPHRRNLTTIALRAPEVPLWSATTCAPYPSDPAAIRALALEHLWKPVRFRELALAMYDAGVRLFVQVGTGSLVGFVEDTLRDRAQLTMSAASADRPGLDQLRRLAAALFVEGVDVDLERLGLPRQATRTGAARRMLALGVPLVRIPATLPKQSPAGSDIVSGDPVLAAFSAAMNEVAAAQSSVLDAWQRGKEPSGRTTRRALSERTFPALRDHSLFRQPDGWPSAADRYPIVPLTTSIAWLIDAAREFAPDRVAIAVEHVRAHRWIAVAPPVDVTITVRANGVDGLTASIDGYLDATIRLGRTYPPPPAANIEPLAEERPSPVATADFYPQRWMFHGPAYQGVVAVGPVARNGIRGTLRTGQAEGALLDNAGQLFGFWMMLNAETDRLAMPIRIRRLELFGPHPATGDLCDCTVRIRKLDAGSVSADIDVTAGGAVWARIEGWEDRRFETDEALWRVLREPEENALAVVQPDGHVLLRDRWRTAQSRDFLMRRYLSERERAEYEALRPLTQRQWLAGRIAAKDAVRHWMWARGSGAVFPVEIQVANEPSGRPVVRGACPDDLSVSIAHKNDLAVALVGAGHAVGIDIEHIVPRDAGFEAMAFTARERDMLPASGRDEWIARFWSAKEAAAKARGTGLAGNPARFEIGERRDELLVVDGTPVQTRIEGEYVIAFTTA